LLPDLVDVLLAVQNGESFKRSSKRDTDDNQILKIFVFEERRYVQVQVSLVFMLFVQFHSGEPLFPTYSTALHSDWFVFQFGLHQSKG